MNVDLILGLMAIGLIVTGVTMLLAGLWLIRYR